MKVRQVWIAVAMAVIVPGIAAVLYFEMPREMAVANSVRPMGSDDRSIAFNRDQLPRMILDANATFNPERVASDFLGISLDPTRLVMLKESAVRLYFVAEAAGFENVLGYQVEGPEIRDSRPKIIFPNATASMDLMQCANLVNSTSPPYYFGSRSPATPVLPGDYVDLGVLPAGTQVVFFIIENGARGGERMYTTIPERNPDGKQHVVTFVYENSPYLLLSFEDMWDTGNRSFNDVVFCVEMSQENLELIASEKEKNRIEALLRANELRRRIKKIVFWGSLAATIVFGPPLFLLTRRAFRRARARRALAAARNVVNADPKQALHILNKNKRFISSERMRREWGAIEMWAGKQTQDAAQLSSLYARMPEVFTEDESASLMAARAQVETNDLDHYHSLRRVWQEREAAPWDWLALEADVLIQQEKASAADSLLDQARFPGPHDSGRMARLGMLRARTNHSAAGDLLAKAARLDPRNPDVYWCHARALEQAGRAAEARAAFSAAVDASPNTPFHRDHLAEFLLRQGNIEGALSIWRERLHPPTLDAIWLKVLFWSRAGIPIHVPWQEYSLPEGALRPLVEFLMRLPSDHFWDSRQAERFAQIHPELLTRPEVIWLRTLDALQRGAENEAFSLLSLGQAGAQPYFAVVETALRQTLTFRRIGFCNPSLRCLYPETPPPLRHPFFEKLDQWTSAPFFDNIAQFEDFIRSAGLFAMVFQAAGWQEAARRFKCLE